MSQLTPRLYVDEDAMNHRVINGLRARGVGVLTAFETGSIGTDDASQLRLASEQRRVLYTFNVADFCRLHSQWMEAGKEHWESLSAPAKATPLASRFVGFQGC